MVAFAEEDFVLRLPPHGLREAWPQARRFLVPREEKPGKLVALNLSASRRRNGKCVLGLRLEKGQVRRWVWELAQMPADRQFAAPAYPPATTQAND